MRKKAIDDTGVGDSGGSKGLDRATRVRGQKKGVGTRDKQNPKAQRAKKIEAWCQGKGDCPL
jgi:hypothetical protein